MKRVCTFFGLLLLICCGLCRFVHGNGSPVTLIAQPLEEKVQAFKGDGKYHVTYELFISNPGASQLQLKSLKVSGNQFTQRYSEEELRTLFAPLGSPLADSYKPLLEPGKSAILFICLDFPTKESIPSQLDTEFVVALDESQKTLFAPSVKVDLTPPMVISSPLQGTHWWTPNALSCASAHRRALYVLDGQLYIAQRFAVDWIKFNDEGVLFQGDSKKNESYFSYGQPVFAIADGEIVMVKDGITENTPGETLKHITYENVMGNSVILKINDNAYAFYAHFIPGSIKVKVGDRVRKGDMIARVGNSGNSSMPHLHFHIATQPEFFKELQQTYPLSATGIPFAIDHFIKQDYTVVKSDKEGFPEKVSFGATAEVDQEMIMTNDLTNFTLQK